MKSQQHLLYLLIFFIVAIISTLAFHDVNSIIARATKIDSIGHLVGFFMLTWLLHGVFKFPLINVAITLVFYGALTEIGQLYLGFRNGELSDFLADVVGITAFVALKWFKLMYFNKRK